MVGRYIFYYWGSRVPGDVFSSLVLLRRDTRLFGPMVRGGRPEFTQAGLRHRRPNPFVHIFRGLANNVFLEVIRAGVSGMVVVAGGR